MFGQLLPHIKAEHGEGALAGMFLREIFEFGKWIWRQRTQTQEASPKVISMRRRPRKHRKKEK